MKNSKKMKKSNKKEQEIIERGKQKKEKLEINLFY